MVKIGIVGKRDAYRTMENYYAAAEACGAEAVSLTAPGDWSGSVPDGLIIPGGGDVDPALYGEENLACSGVNRALDDLEMALIGMALRDRRPILGICRGHQILNVYFGGSLIQDIPQADRHRHTEAGDQAHPAIASEGSFLTEVFGATEFNVNSAHHQAVKTLGSGLIAVQRSDDGVIEAVAHGTLPVYGVQWHPERMCLANRREDTIDALPLFQWFVRAVCTPTHA